MEAELRREPPRRAPAPPIGRSLPERLGRYTLVHHLGRGGMADVYLAGASRADGTPRLVAVKEPIAGREAAEGEALLVAEARLGARLRHDNVVRVEEIGREQGKLFLVLEYVEGLDLRELVRRSARHKLGLPADVTLFVVAELLRALDHVHRLRDDEGRAMGLVHRDVSPANVLLGLRGEVKLCDFGIASAAADAREAPILGKAGYMSPEQARGEPVDARTDLFAAGIILWELVAGRRLYRAAPGETLLDLARRADIPALPPTRLPLEGELRKIAALALAPRASDRYPSASDMLDELEGYLARARLSPSRARFARFVCAHFGDEALEARRSAERSWSGPSGLAPVSFARRSTLPPRARFALEPAAGLTRLLRAAGTMLSLPR